MDIKNALDYKHEYFTSQNVSGNNRYKYEQEGILKRCLPKKMFEGNSILVTFLQLIDLRLIMMFKYIDKIKRFKYITWY